MHIKRGLAPLLVVVLLLAGCRAVAPTPAPSPGPETSSTPEPAAQSTPAPTQAATQQAPRLVGHAWQWVSFTNPVEEYAVDAPGKYTLTFNKDGTVSILADCNRAQGGYEVERSSLKIQVGPTTLAVCPPGSRSDEFLKYLGYSAIYSFRDGNLLIDLFADGGTLTFAPVDAAAVSPDAVGTVSEVPRLSYLICDWGLLTVEERAKAHQPYIHIESPADYSGVQGPTFTVTGTAGELPTQSLILEAALGGDSAYFTENVPVETAGSGSEGTWSVDVPLSGGAASTKVFVTVYAVSPSDGSTVAYASLRLNGNSEFGLPFVAITTPYFAQGVSSSPLEISGTAGGAFENNIVVEVQDFSTHKVLATAPAAIKTDQIGGSGPFSVSLAFDAEPGTSIEIHAYHPPVAGGNQIAVSDVAFAIVNPLGRTFDRFLNMQRDDPLYGAQSVCETGRAEFDNQDVLPLVINDAAITMTQSMIPLVKVSIDAAGPSVCPLPLRTRTVRDGARFDIETYYDNRHPAACTRDLAPKSIQVSLGTLPSPDITITVNGRAFR